MGVIIQGQLPKAELVKGNYPGGKSLGDNYSGGNFMGAVVWGLVVQGRMSGYHKEQERAPWEFRKKKHKPQT